MRLIHYSAEPLTEVWSRPHDDAPVGPYKTTGLWVSVEGEYDWPWWCINERFGLERLACATEIILRADHNVLIIPTVAALDEFAHVYRKDDHGIRVIDWERVRQQHQGVIIAPYQWDRRLARHTHWYYGWDCASGVIWDANAIEAFSPTETVTIPLEDVRDEPGEAA